MLALWTALAGRQGPDPMGAKRVMTGRDGHFAPLECLSAEAFCHLPMARKICPRASGETKVQKVGLFILSCKYASDFASAQTPASSSSMVFAYPVAPPLKTHFGHFVPVIHADISSPHLHLGPEL